MEERIRELADLFDETGKAHHQAYFETDGFDPDWPLWYADYLLDRLLPLIETDMSRNEVADLLLDLSKIQPAEAPEAWWPQYYAQYVVDHKL